MQSEVEPILLNTMHTKQPRPEQRDCREIEGAFRIHNRARQRTFLALKADSFRRSVSGSFTFHSRRNDLLRFIVAPDK